jgi:Spy/CpxP family protein refolding chaperone
MKPRMLFKAVLCSLFVFTLSFGQGMQRPNAGPPHERMLEKLNLSDTQKKDVEKLNTDFAKQKVEQRAKIKIAAIELHSLMKADSPDKGAIEKKINEISDLQAQNRMLGVNHWFSVNKLLTPDQQKIWKSVLDRPLRDRFAARMERMGQMRNGMMMRSHQRPMPPENPQQ